MPKHHQYFGSPATSYIFRKLLGIPTGAIHCGIRALTKDLYSRLPFTESGWEYASEMIVSSRNLGARITEIPVNFYKEPIGRISHHKRNGWLTPFKAGWGTLRVTVAFSFDRLLELPGRFIGILGMAFTLAIAINPIYFRQHFSIGVVADALLFTISVFGFFMFSVGRLCHFIYFKNSKRLEWLGTRKRSEIFFFITALSSLSSFISISILVNNWFKWTDSSQTIVVFENSHMISLNFFLLSFTFYNFSNLLTTLIANYMRKINVNNSILP
jgi:hypothetical protein